MMKQKINGITLYDLNTLPIKTIYQFAHHFFNLFNIIPNHISYMQSHSSDSQGETVSEIEASLEELQYQIDNNLIDNFRLLYSSTDRLWDVGFAFFDKQSEVGEEMNYIEIQFLDNISTLESEKIIHFLTTISAKTHIVYGIGYQLYGSMSEVFSYALGLGVETLYNNESPYEWGEQLPSRTDETPLYFNQLRMVYPINILNDNHLNFPLSQLTLKAWILSNNKNGKITNLDNQNYLWLVEASELERINAGLSKEGILISANL
ncbi:hypothetical protein [Pasteurella atlantica]|uniref:hypothetical protein n=1 Tax=Pasteurellaceae TaxID=712 RepID=UPI0027524442|nr:hypothetical protein [Pasteurella atlantica]MDP8099279.1 hypothetical protein [Pasteurella atlantica]MDP8106162.1 hypothetical protein [Pasteurella atlantica]